MTFFILSLYEILLLIPSPRAGLIYEHFPKLTFNTQGGNSYLNEFVYAEGWQIMLEVFVQKAYNPGIIFPVGLVKFKLAGNEFINSRAVAEANIFNKRFWNKGRSTQLVISLWRCWLCCDVRVALCPVLHSTNPTRRHPRSRLLPSSDPGSSFPRLNSMWKTFT